MSLTFKNATNVYDSEGEFVGKIESYDENTTANTFQAEDKSLFLAEELREIADYLENQ